MKKSTLISAAIFANCLLLTANCFSQGTAINTTGNPADSSAMLDVSSTSKGMLVPRMTEAQKTAILSPAEGLVIYQTDNSKGFWYFNGTIWVQLIAPAGPAGATGNTGATGAAGATGSGGLTHFIGEMYGGGVVVALWKESGVEKGLIASLIDIETSGGSSTMAWSGTTNVLIGPAAQSYNNGQANTNAIIAQNNTPDKAATVCDSYVNADYGTGVYSDWYLPSLTELELCYDSKPIINFITGNTIFFLNIYWSSTEDSYNSALSINLNTGARASTTKSSGLRARAVRKF